MIYWAIKNTFIEFDVTVEEELLFCGVYTPEYYKARRQYGTDKKSKWTENWLPMVFANDRINEISAVLVKDNEKTKEEIEEIEKDK